MVKDARVTKNTRHSYATRSNLIKKVKTPGGRLSVKIIKKKSSGVKCGEAGCDVMLPGIKKMSTSAFRQSKKRERKVSRTYGGNLCGTCVQNRIVRAFLIEEQKIVKKMLAQKK
ncbi:hypothetical protein TrCOL_g10689 [Triparma columacea]|jgi:large subunit ribosomal protein L34e|uniref:60S ribosomal protein L34 n=1 Tax=Triparma columacea TaxID=722753 RepID=A0A9W7GE47_9STRA|nr:hypothetical protein TrCOL_g10689 [Triparma columacea]